LARSGCIAALPSITVLNGRGASGCSSTRGATESRLTFRGRSIPFHGHLFREADGDFRFTDRDKNAYPTELLDELEDIANGALI